MKITLAFSILFCAIALPGFAELTDADINKIRLIVKDSENGIKEHIKSEISASEKRTKEYISQEIETVNVKIETVNVKISETDKRLSQIFWLVIALTGLIAAAIGVPQWLAEQKGTANSRRMCSLANRRKNLLKNFFKNSPLNIRR